MKKLRLEKRGKSKPFGSDVNYEKNLPFVSAEVHIFASSILSENHEQKGEKFSQKSPNSQNKNGFFFSRSLRKVSSELP